MFILTLDLRVHSIHSQALCTTLYTVRIYLFNDWWFKMIIKRIYGENIPTQKWTKKKIEQ